MPNSKGKRRRKGGSGNLIAPLPLSPPPSVPRHNYGMRGTNYDLLFPPFLVRRGGGGGSTMVLLQWREGIPAAQTHPPGRFFFGNLFDLFSDLCSEEGKYNSLCCLIVSGKNRITVTKLDLSLLYVEKLCVESQVKRKSPPHFPHV